MAGCQDMGWFPSLFRDSSDHHIGGDAAVPCVAHVSIPL